ncbi:hypothetical protein CLU79DRAFT_832617 [Phycomyces nitens]|nr:hypothetical protein CLU79DRAFT_832617 [Phycomyces nitens]
MPLEKKPLGLQRVNGVLTFVQSASALSFSTFAIIHGTQIAIAAINGVDGANQSLLMARPFYQDKNLETILVTGAATVHVLAGLAKTAIRRSSKTLVPPSLPSLHRVSGFVLVPLVLLHHHLVRRLPAQYFGDSAFVDFGVVSWGLQNRPWFTWGLHTLLIGATVYHGVGGLRLAWRRVFGSSSLSAPKSRSRSIVGVGIGCVLFGGLIAVSRTSKIPLRREYKEIYDMMFQIK